jgi:hypothetical protein
MGYWVDEFEKGFVNTVGFSNELLSLVGLFGFLFYSTKSSALQILFNALPRG